MTFKSVLYILVMNLVISSVGFGKTIDQQWDLPTFTVQLTDSENASPPIVTSFSSVSAEEEAGLIKMFIINRDNDEFRATNDPLFILVSDQEPLALTLRKAQAGLQEKGIFIIEVPQNIVALSQELSVGTPQKRMTASREWTLEGLQRTGTLVGISCATVFSGLFFATHQVGPAAMAATLAFTLQILGNKFAQSQLRFFNYGGDLSQRIAGKLTTPAMATSKTVHEIGRWINGYLFNFMTSAAFTVVLSQNSMSLHDSAKIVEGIAMTAAFGLASDNSWDMGFAEQMKKAEESNDQQRLKTLIFMKYTKSIFLTLVSPFMFMESTRPFAMTVLAGFGTLGFTARAFPKPFTHLAEFAMTRMEKSEQLNRLISSITGLRSALKYKRSRACHNLFSKK